MFPGIIGWRAGVHFGGVVLCLWPWGARNQKLPEVMGAYGEIHRPRTIPWRTAPVEDSGTWRSVVERCLLALFPAIQQAADTLMNWNVRCMNWKIWWNTNWISLILNVRLTDLLNRQEKCLFCDKIVTFAVKNKTEYKNMSQNTFCMAGGVARNPLVRLAKPITQLSERTNI